MGAINISNPSYADIVRKYFEDDSTEVFPNGCEEHAKVIIEQIFRHAQDYVYVLSTNLAKSTWNDSVICEAVRGALERGVSVRISIQENTIDANSLQELLSEFNIEINLNRDITLGSNFIVSDDKMFRYEENRDRVEAIASANYPELAIILRDYYRSNVA